MKRGPPLSGFAILALGACELQQVTLAEPEDIVVAEVVLEAGATRQLALLHRTHGSDGGVPDARIEVRDDAGASFLLLPAPDSLCLLPSDSAGARTSTCFAADTPTDAVMEDRTYHLHIDLPGAGAIDGTTTVPGAFDLLRPVSDACYLPAGDTLDLAWTPSDRTWAYIVETLLIGIREPLARRGITIEQDTIRLLGLAVARDDTTIVFPTEFGLFDRFNADLTDALVVLQQGLLDGVDADIVVGAADRNWVNWARGGNFNPSGFVQVPSVFGAGTGVFGSVVTRRLRVTTRPGAALAPCRAGQQPVGLNRRS